MASIKQALMIFLCSGLFFSLESCNGVGKKKKYPNSQMYDFASPHVVRLPTALDEISGIAYYPKDTSVFAIIDEDGLLFKIPIMNPDATKEWRFDKQRDYEDILLLDSTFYILVSNGDVVSVKFTGSTIIAEKSDFSDQSKKANEFEAMYYNADSNKIVIVCKDCEGDTKKNFSSFTYHYNSPEKSYSPFINFSSEPIAQKLGLEKLHLKASAAAINPVSEDIYFLSTINSLIVITSKKGQLKQVFNLDPGIYKQAEGIAFTPQGDLIISNEFGDNGFAELLIMKNKLKGR